jgi:hypothetical protein
MPPHDLPRRPNGAGQIAFAGTDCCHHPPLGLPTDMVTEEFVRTALRRRATASAPNNAVIVDEFWIPRSHERADLAVIGHLREAFEIKTERDNLNRLPRQASAYGRLFDECTAVVAERHAVRVATMLPEWWGLLVIPVGDASFETVRGASRNPDVDPETIVRLLWRDEVYAALTRFGITPEPGAGRSAMWAALLRHLDSERLSATVTEALLRRDPADARIPTRRFSSPSVSSPAAG